MHMYIYIYICMCVCVNVCVCVCVYIHVHLPFIAPRSFVSVLTLVDYNMDFEMTVIVYGFGHCRCVLAAKCAGQQ